MSKHFSSAFIGAGLLLGAVACMKPAGDSEA